MLVLGLFEIGCVSFFLEKVPSQRLFGARSLEYTEAFPCLDCDDHQRRPSACLDCFQLLAILRSHSHLIPGNEQATASSHSRNGEKK